MCIYIDFSDIYILRVYNTCIYIHILCNYLYIIRVVLCTYNITTLYSAGSNLSWLCRLSRSIFIGLQIILRLCTYLPTHGVRQRFCLYTIHICAGTVHVIQNIIMYSEYSSFSIINIHTDIGTAAVWGTLIYV